MEKPVTIAQFIEAIKRLPEDEPVEHRSLWYRTQKEHWLGWLSHYDEPGPYRRKTGQNRDAKFAYNHIVCPEMLLYLIRSIGLRRELVEEAERACESSSRLSQKSGAIRKVVPWSEVQRAIGDGDRIASPLTKLLRLWR